MAGLARAPTSGHAHGVSSPFRFEDAAREAVYRVIASRRDVRAYRSDPVPDDVLARILRAAHAAPSVGFMQPWRFTLVRAREDREAVHRHFAEVNVRAAEVHPGERGDTYRALKLQGLLDAPLHVVVTCDPDAAGEHVLGRYTMPETDVYSTCLAVQNLWLAARAEGIGVGWMSIMEPAAIRRLLDIPERVAVVAYLTLGVPITLPDEPLLARVGWRQRTPLDALVHEGRYGATPTDGLAHALASNVAAPDGEDDEERARRAALGPRREPPPAAVERQRALTKPPGSLGRLEALHAKLAGVQGRAQPVCDEVACIVFAGDHGAARASSLSAYRPDVTAQMVYQYLSGGGAIAALCRAEGVPLHIVDVGVDHDFGEARALEQHKVRRGTRDFTREDAMTTEECAQALDAGRQAVARRGLCDALALGEVGIGNSTAAAGIVAAALGLSGAEVVGAGTGVGAETRARKAAAIDAALARSAPRTALEGLRVFGGYEIAALAGAMEAAFDARTLVVLDGFIAGAAALVAAELRDGFGAGAIAAHRSAEPGHAAVLERLRLMPLFSLGLRLGEGTGALIGLSLVRLSAAVSRDMRTWDEANLREPIDALGRR